MILRWSILATMVLSSASEVDDWDGLVKTYVEAYESAKEPVPTGAPWLAKRHRALFNVRGVGHIQVFTEGDGQRKLMTDIYYKPDEVHVINHSEGYSLITKGKEAYEWQAGGKEGLITKLGDDDLIDYLLYLIDPSWIMLGIYQKSLEEPGMFFAPQEVEDGCIERRLKEPIHGFRAVLVSDDPAWLCGVEFEDPKSKKPIRQIYTKPKSLKEVPAQVLDRIKGVEFQKSDLSIRRHMVFL